MTRSAQKPTSQQSSTATDLSWAWTMQTSWYTKTSHSTQVTRTRSWESRSMSISPLAKSSLLLQISYQMSLQPERSRYRLYGRWSLRSSEYTCHGSEQLAGRSTRGLSRYRRVGLRYQTDGMCRVRLVPARHRHVSCLGRLGRTGCTPARGD
jgi:hypothetical protein